MLIKNPINEFSTEVFENGVKKYTEIGAGINHQKDDGSFAESSAVFVASARTGIQWECYTTHNRVGLKNDIASGAYSVFSQIGNTGKILKSKPTAIAYLNIDTKEWQIFANLQSSTAVVNGNKIKYANAFLNCDLEYVIEKDRLKQNLYIKSKAGFPASPYPANKTYVVVVTKFDLANYELPTLRDERGSISFNDSGDETDGEIKFTSHSFTMCDATDNNGVVQKIKKRLIKYNGENYLLEGLPYSYLVGASYPVLLDYTTVNSDISTATWSSGTYYISSSVAVAENNTLTISAGVVVKFGHDVKLSADGLDVNGSVDSWVVFTSWNDDTVGETIDGSSGTPANDDWAGIGTRYWHSGHPTLDYFIIRHATRGINIQYNTYSGHSTWTLNNFIIKNCYYTGVYWWGNGTSSSITMKDGQIDNCYFGFYLQDVSGGSSGTRILVIHNSAAATTQGYGNGRVTWTNCTFDSNYVGPNGVDDCINCIISNNNYDHGSINMNYCLEYGNTSHNSPLSNTNALSEASPAFVSGEAIAEYLGDMTYFLDQATSPCIDAGSDTAANLLMDGSTTATDATLDGSTADVGYHYNPDYIAVSGGEETAAFTAAALSLAVPSVTATYVELDAAVFTALAASLTVPSVTATFVNADTADFTSIALGLTVPAMTATSAEGAVAAFTPLAVSLAAPTTTATYVALLSATFTPLAATITVPATTATHVVVLTATFTSAALTLAVPANTATYVALLSAAFTPAALTLTVPAMTATVAGEFVGSFTSLSLTLSQPATTATYVYSASATFTALGLTLTQPALAASYIDEDVAAFNALALQFATPGMLAIFEEMDTAAFAPASLVLTIPPRYASESPLAVAVFDSLSLILTIPSFSAIVYRETVSLSSKISKTSSLGSGISKTVNLSSPIDV